MSSSVKYGAQRSLSSEILSLSTVMLTPVLLAMVFPYRAIGFDSEASQRELKASSSIVFLSSEEEADLLSRSRSAWQNDEGSVNIDMTIEWLPELDSKSVVDSPVIHTIDRQSRDIGKVSLIPPTMAAPSARKIETIASEKCDVFDKSDLLKLK